LLLWRGLLERDPSLEDGPYRDVALAACVTADRLDEIDVLCRGPIMVKGRGGRLVVNPALGVARQQALHLMRLLAALRLPDSSGRRPQRRSARGVYQPSRDAMPHTQSPQPRRKQ